MAGWTSPDAPDVIKKSIEKHEKMMLEMAAAGDVSPASPSPGSSYLDGVLLEAMTRRLAVDAMVAASRFMETNGLKIVVEPALGGPSGWPSVMVTMSNHEGRSEAVLFSIGTPRDAMRQWFRYTAPGLMKS